MFSSRQSSNTVGRWFAAVLAAGLLAGCASTSVDGTWTRPEFAGQRIEGKVLVVGVMRDETLRRLFEDELHARLTARGVGSVRSYELLPATLGAEGYEAVLNAAKTAGASFVLSTAVIGQRQEQVVRQDTMWAGGSSMGAYRGWYRSSWGMSMPVRTEVHTFTVFTAETVLASVAAERIEWTMRSRTTEPTNLDRETKAFADLILRELTRSNLLPPA